MKTFSNPGELAGAVGTTLGTSSYQTVLQHDVDVFAALTGDLQWIHIDLAKARSGPFGGPVAHEMYTLSLLLPMLGDVFTVDSVATVVHRGFDNVRFSAPVPVGARVRVSAEVRAADTRAQGFTEVVLAAAVEVEGQQGSACTADLRLLYQEEVASGWLPLVS